jgi:tripartite-type tricarboxylate transporter receptor subunit TctC
MSPHARLIAINGHGAKYALTRSTISASFATFFEHSGELRMYAKMLMGLGAAIAAGFGPSSVLAQQWPAKPVRIIVPFPAGGGVDYIGRVMAKHLTERLGQQVVVDNRAGSNGIVGLEVLKNAPPDGYTLSAASNGPLVNNLILYSKLPYDTLRDFAPISNMVMFPLMLVTHPSLPVKTSKELIALARSKPGEVIFSSPGTGNGGHLAAELFNSLAKVKMLHIPYKGTAPANVAVLSGETHLTYSSIPSVLPHVRANRLRAIGIGNASRLPSLSDIPTIAETGLPGYEAFSWGGMVAPAKTPAAIVNRLNREINEILKQKDVADALIRDGTLPVPDTAEKFSAYIKADIDKWTKVVRDAGIKAE